MSETKNKIIWWLEAVRVVIAAIAGLLAGAQ